MDRKYWVPALEKADLVLRLIAEQQRKLRLIDLSNRLGINKSTMFSLLHTLEELGWIVKDAADTYALGSVIGRFGTAYSGGNDVFRAFQREAPGAAAAIGETVQLATLAGNEVLYVAKHEVPSPIRLASDPGMKFPAHVTALGKVLLAGLPEEQRRALYPSHELEPRLTPYSLTTREALLAEVAEAEAAGCAYDRQEAVVGFYCVAAPVRSDRGQVVAAVSCSMPAHVWEHKQDTATREIVKLAARMTVYS
ncbi:IclR family transcriptional regulator [Paenibacillus chartarius]|uniref:IclR family transcriptional regulator n=1 Tax=Paenibacillus chartarius TaxID=747481 RepID=A0ABV6DQP4_9BACL